MDINEFVYGVIQRSCCFQALQVSACFQFFTVLAGLAISNVGAAFVKLRIYENVLSLR